MVLATPIMVRIAASPLDGVGTAAPLCPGVQAAAAIPAAVNGTAPAVGTGAVSARITAVATPNPDHR